MMKIKLLLAFGLLNYSVFSQETQLQNFTPKSPEAAAFLKYGEYPIDLSTGLANISIPIYTIKTGDYELPISLNYHPSGIKVSDEATWVGLGWNLNAGAQIVLEVRDTPDEYTGSYNIVPKANDVNAYIYNHPLGYFDSYFLNLKSESWVRDVYNFTSPTANGKFIIDNIDTKEITIYPPDAFKVELFGSATSKQFKITDKDGNIYYFNDTKEKSQTLQQYQPPLYTSAWFVDRIETPKHDIIDFNYIDGGDLYQTSFGEIINHNKTILPNYACIEGGVYQKETISSLISNNSRLHTVTKKINQIIFNGGRVLFNSSSGRLDFYNENNINTLNDGPKKLDLIEIQSKNNLSNTYATTKDYRFYYSYFNSDQPNRLYANTTRLKLDKIAFKSFAIDNPEETIFTYSSIQLPSKDSKSIDYYGYFNGKTNASRIPHQVIAYTPNGVSTSYEIIGNADRTVNPLTIEAGVLKEIKYPTKGTSKFEYEPNTYYGVNKSDKFNIQPPISGNLVQGTGLADTPPSINHKSAYTPGASITELSLPFKAINAQGVLSFSIRASSSLGKYKYASVKVYDSTGLKYSKRSNVTEEAVSYNISNLNGNCSIEIEAYGQYMSVANTQLRYYNNDTNNPKDNLGTGLRIKSITNINHTSDTISKKIYEYTNNLNHSSGLLVNDIYTTFQANDVYNYFHSCCNMENEGGGSVNRCDWAWNITSSFTSNSINGIESNSVIYSDVIEKNISSNNTTNGYSLSKFTTDADYLIDTKGIIQVEKNYKRGKLLSKELYKASSSGNYLLINKLTNEYTEDNRKTSFVKGFKLFQHSFLCCSLLNNTLPVSLNTIFEPVSYNIPVLWFYKKASESTDYFYNSSNVLIGSLVNNTNYFYDNPTHLQLTKTEETTSNNGTIITKKYYPDDLPVIPLMSNLKDQYRIGEVVKTEVFKNTNLLTTQNIKYKDWGNNLIASEIIQSSKGSGGLEDKIKFNLLDNTNGNPLELQMVDGTTIVYIWGYNQTQPVAKIENTTYASISPSLIAAIETASNTGTEASLLTALSNLRNDSSLANAMITTYTYIPLVGVSTITDPKGDTITYTYDSFGRLQNVKDKNGNILSENEYHYKN